MPVLAAALTHLERARLHFNESGLPAVQALPLALPGGVEAQPIEQPAEQVRGLGVLGRRDVECHAKNSKA